MKEALKRLRSSQPFNYLATTSVRAVLSATGLQSEQVIKHLHRVGTVETRLPNGRTLRLWSRADDWVSNQVFWRGWKGYEPETVPLFFRLASEAKVILDVGAYVGFFTLLAALASPDGRVFAFEPLRAIHKRLDRNVQLNGLNNVTLIQAAVGGEDGSAEFFHVDVGLPTSSSLSYQFMQDADHLTSSKVPVLTLDSFVSRHGLAKVDLLKIDTESTELEVLRGGRAMLGRDRPTIFCEVLEESGCQTALEELLAPLGYAFYLLTPQGAERRERIEGHPVWFNYLFTTDEADSLT
ncbi:MAG: FkbM family methyltransferase [Acidobacteriota bacterium]